MNATELDGVRVIAVEQAVAAPLCTRHLADLGADVVKIERPDGGDFARRYDGAVKGHSSHFVWLNRGKRSVVLNLKSQEGRLALRRLLSTADVLVSNLAPGSFDRVITDDELERLNTRLIRCYISGYGTTGPYAARKAYDLLVQGEAGTIAATGTPDQRAKPGVSLADVAGGTYALAAVTAALYARERTGRGERIDIALFDVLLEWMSPLLLAELSDGSAPEPAGLSHASISPYGPYVTADGETLLIAVQNDGQWRRLCELVLRDPSLVSDPDLVSNDKRSRNRKKTEMIVNKSLSAMSTKEAVALLDLADVPHGQLKQLRDVVAHEQARATERWSPAHLPDGETVSVVTPPFYRNAEAQPGRAVPRLGEHTAAVLLAAGFSDAEVSQLTSASAGERQMFRG